jgi:hypothetical protein
MLLAFTEEWHAALAADAPFLALPEGMLVMLSAICLSLGDLRLVARAKGFFMVTEPNFPSLFFFAEFATLLGFECFMVVPLS